MLVKICGLTTPEAVDAASEADLVGFVFAPSPRQVTAEQARDLAARLPERVRRVAVFQDATAEEIAAVCAIFPADLVQVEPGPTLPPGVGLLPVFHDHSDVIAEVERCSDALILLEAAGSGGGSGQTGDWSRAAALAGRRAVVLAGGLRPENIAEAIASVRPAGVDVSSGVERSRGVKDPARIRAFIGAARAAARDLSHQTRGQ
jgi:phosphoribosylanthranilate isomerase